MPRDHLETELEDAIDGCHRRTTIQIILGDDSTLNLSTGDCEVGELTFLGKLAPVDALNLELTSAFEGISLQISNVGKTLGQTLINTPDILSGTKAILGCYFEDPQTGDKWHDEKMDGEIEVGDIDGDWINIFFKSKPDAAVYGGIVIADAFPESAIPDEELPDVTVNQIYNDINPSNVERKNGLRDEWQTEKYYLPEISTY